MDWIWTGNVITSKFSKQYFERQNLFVYNNVQDPKCWQVDCDKGPDSDKMAFSAFVRELKEVFEPRGLLLSAAVSPNKKVIDQGKVLKI